MGRTYLTGDCAQCALELENINTCISSVKYNMSYFDLSHETYLQFESLFYISCFMVTISPILVASCIAFSLIWGSGTIEDKFQTTIVPCCTTLV